MKRIALLAAALSILAWFGTARSASNIAGAAPPARTSLSMTVQAPRALYLPFVRASSRTTPSPTPIGGGGGGTGQATFFLPYRLNSAAITNHAPQVVIDPVGGVHTVYTANAVDQSGQRPAYYGYCPANCTSTTSFTTVALGTNMSTAQLALDPAGHPRLLLHIWPANSPIIYAYAACDRTCTDAANWTITPITAGPSTFFVSDTESNQSFTIDPQGRPRFVYYANSFGATEGTLTGVVYASCDNACTDVSNWLLTQLSPQEWSNFALTATPNGGLRLAASFTSRDSATFGQPMIVYLECDTACVDAGNWRSITLLTTTTQGTRATPAFALRTDAAGHMRMALYIGTTDFAGSGDGSFPANYLYYLSCDTGCTGSNSWRVVNIGLPPYQGEGGVDLRLDAQNRPRIAYHIPAENLNVPLVDELAYAWCNTQCETGGQPWQQLTIPSTAAAQQELGLPPTQGCPDCVPPIPPCPSAFWNAGLWPSLALDAAGDPRIAYEARIQQGGGQCEAADYAIFSRLAVRAQP